MPKKETYKRTKSRKVIGIDFSKQMIEKYKKGNVGIYSITVTGWRP